MDKYGLDKFNIYAYEYFNYENKTVSSKALTDLETSYITRFDLRKLYNYKVTATSMLGYKHTEYAILKMKKHYENKNNHPMFGKTRLKRVFTLN